MVGLGLPPSEVRAMTLGELYAVIDARAELNKPKPAGPSEETTKRLVKNMKEARAKQCQTK